MRLDAAFLFAAIWIAPKVFRMSLNSDKVDESIIYKRIISLSFSGQFAKILQLPMSYIFDVVN
jgi:hypothetical protein